MITITKIEDSAPKGEYNHGYVWLISIVAAMGGLLFGWDWVVIGGEFQPEDFQRFVGRRALVLVDAEGAELDILDPVRGPALAHMSIIVETHDVYRPGALASLMARFSTTHDIERVDQDFKSYDAPDWVQNLSHLDQLLTVWEWRQRPTPWLVMRPKSGRV